MRNYILHTFTIKHFYYYDTKGGKLLKRCARRGKYSHKMRSQTIVGIVSLVSLQIFKNTLRNPSSFDTIQVTEGSQWNFFGTKKKEISAEKRSPTTF